MHATIAHPFGDGLPDLFGFDLEPLGAAWEQVQVAATVFRQGVVLAAAARRARAEQRAADRRTLAAAATASVAGRNLASRIR